MDCLSLLNTPKQNPFENEAQDRLGNLCSQGWTADATTSEPSVATEDQPSVSSKTIISTRCQIADWVKLVDILRDGVRVLVFRHFSGVLHSVTKLEGDGYEELVKEGIDPDMSRFDYVCGRRVVLAEFLKVVESSYPSDAITLLKIADNVLRMRYANHWTPTIVAREFGEFLHDLIMRSASWYFNFGDIDAVILRPVPERPYEFIAQMHDGRTGVAQDYAIDATQLFELVPALNGANGEATNSDDVKGAGKKAAMRMATKVAHKAVRVVKREAPKAVKAVKKHREQGGSVHPIVDSLLDAFTMPSDRTRRAIGLPTYPNVDSQKARGFINFTMTTGTAGYGVIGINPTIASDKFAVVYSSSASTYAGTTIPAMNAAVVGTSTGTVSNLPYANSSLGATAINGRIVTAGIEFESTTSTLYEQGVIQVYVDPAHNDLTGASVSTLSARRGCLTLPIKKGEKHYLAIPPVAPAETQYGTSQIPYNSSSSAVIACVLVSGASATNPVTLLARYTSDVEYVGPAAENVSTPNGIAPPDALNHCVEIASKIQLHKHANHHSALRPAHLADLAKKAYRVINSGAARKVVKDVFGASLLL